MNVSHVHKIQIHRTVIHLVIQFINVSIEVYIFCVINSIKKSCMLLTHQSQCTRMFIDAAYELICRHFSFFATEKLHFWMQPPEFHLCLLFQVDLLGLAVLFY